MFAFFVSMFMCDRRGSARAELLGTGLMVGWLSLRKPYASAKANRRFSMWWNWRCPRAPPSRHLGYVKHHFVCMPRPPAHTPAERHTGRTKLFSWWRFVEIHSARQITVLAELGLNESVLAAIKLFSSDRQFCVSSVRSQSACGGVLRILPSVFFRTRSRTAQRDFLRTLRRAITHCISTHRRSTGTLCYLAHSSHMVSVVLKFQSFFTLRTEQSATAEQRQLQKLCFFKLKFHPPSAATVSSVFPLRCLACCGFNDMHRTKKRRGRARLPGEASSFHDGQARLSSQTLTNRQLFPHRERRRFAILVTRHFHQILDWIRNDSLRRRSVHGQVQLQ